MSLMRSPERALSIDDGMEQDTGSVTSNDNDSDYAEETPRKALPPRAARPRPDVFAHLDGNESETGGRLTFSGKERKKRPVTSVDSTYSSPALGSQRDSVTSVRGPKKRRVTSQKERAEPVVPESREEEESDTEMGSVSDDIAKTLVPFVQSARRAESPQSESALVRQAKDVMRAHVKSVQSKLVAEEKDLKDKLIELLQKSETEKSQLQKDVDRERKNHANERQRIAREREDFSILREDMAQGEEEFNREMRQIARERQEHARLRGDMAKEKEELNRERQRLEQDNAECRQLLTDQEATIDRYNAEISQLRQALTSERDGRQKAEEKLAGLRSTVAGALEDSK